MVLAGTLAKASSLGAKTVKGRLFLWVSVSPAVEIAFVNVLKEPELVATSRISAILYLLIFWSMHSLQLHPQWMLSSYPQYRPLLKIIYLYLILLRVRLLAITSTAGVNQRA